MEDSLEQLCKEFGIQLPDKRKWDHVRGTVSRTWKAATTLTRRRSQGQPSPLAVTSQDQPQQWRFPLELLEQIVDYLHHDFQTLRSCALVCQALVPAARQYLFHTVLIREKNFVNAVVLFVRNPHIAWYVRDLYFEAGENAFETLQALLQGKQPSKLLRVFALVIAPRLPNVIRFTMKDVSLDRGVVWMLAPLFPKLYAFSLFDCWFRCNADLDALVKAHPLVHTLRCGRLCSVYGASGPDSGEQPGVPMRMRSLKITEAYSPSPLTLMPWLVTHIEPETFIFTLYRLSQVAKLNQSISGYSTLRHLHVILYHWRKGDTREVIECPQAMAVMPRHPASIVALTLDAKLHSLLLVVYILGQLDLEAFVRLSSVNIIAHLLAEDVEEIEPSAWAAMDKALSVLLSLGTVHFTNSCNDTSHVKEARAAIVARLPTLAARNVLTFTAQKPRV
ncbi:hypothetical protein BD413DRAFT_230346 [Trametes elegans]|nr:hypothetical protein BD413DRAFT_230346 [Trametes elegans]